MDQIVDSYYETTLKETFKFKSDAAATRAFRYKLALKFDDQRLKS
jgi:hypothetical protein